MNNIVLVKTSCPFCRKETSFEIPSTAYRKWKYGASIQDAMPFLPAENREQLISGVCPQCFDSYFGIDEEYEEDDSNIEMGFNPYSGCYDFDC